MPLKICFDITFTDLDLKWLYITPLIVLSLNVLITLNTAFYEEGVIIKDRNKIFRRYIRQNLIPDLLGTAALIVGEKND